MVARPQRIERGVTLIECVVTAGILLLMASAVVPSTRYFVKRQKELQLQEALREIRGSIDAYHFAAKNGLIQVQGVRNTQHPYPENLEQLVEGVPGVGAWANPSKIKFLRRIPRDPMMPPGETCDEAGWRLRSTTHKPGFSMWDRMNVMDVRSCSEAKSANGSYYKDW